MRSVPENIYSAVVRIHCFTLRRRVMTVGGLIYLVGAVIATMWRQQARMLGQIPFLPQIKVMLTGLTMGIGQLIQQALSLIR